MSDPPPEPKELLRSPRMWIYIVMIVGGMIWGIYFIVHVLRSAR